MTSVPARLTAFGALLALVFAGALLLGGAVGPEPTTADEPSHAAGGTHGEEAMGPATSAVTPGLAVTQDGLRLALDRTAVAGTGRQTVSFRILGEDGDALRDFDVEHTKRLHLIVVRRDLAGFQHLHPTLDADGRWTADDVVFATGGTYRVFADFSTDGVKRTLGADVQVPGAFTPQRVPAPAATSTDDRGLTVRRRSEADGSVAFDVLRDGRVVNDELEDYLGAKGHLVTLRAGDLAYLHTHPADDRLAFMVDDQGPGTFRSWVQFQLGGVVHTAAFTEETVR